MTAPKLLRKSDGSTLMCEVCEGKEPAYRVASVPGVPYSAAYGAQCLRANAHPWWVLLAVTIDLGGLEEAADWWVRMVDDTCKHLGRTKAEFHRQMREIG